MQLDINRAERLVLVEVLEDRLGTLREQIYHTTTTEYKEALKQRKALLRELIKKAASAAPEEAAP